MVTNQPERLYQGDRPCREDRNVSGLPANKAAVARRKNRMLQPVGSNTVRLSDFLPGAKQASILSPDQDFGVQCHRP